MCWLLFLSVVLSPALSACSECLEPDGDTTRLLQSLARPNFAVKNSIRTPESEAFNYLAVKQRKPGRSTRDLAIIDVPLNISLTSDIFFVIYSAVPVFGDDHTGYIALLSDRADTPDTFRKKSEGSREERAIANRPWTYMDEHPIYCKGEGSHSEERKKVEVKGRSLFCPWSFKDRETPHIKVILEDGAGETLGSLVAKHVPGLLKNYDTMACVRDVFLEPDAHAETGSQGAFLGPFKQLVEWLEFQAMSGVDHFLFYTFKGNEDAMLEVMRPYIEKGLATRVHFDYQPWEQMVRQGFLANDCLFRARNHAKWLMPTIDIDEYIFRDSNGPIQQTFFSELWDSILKTNKLERTQVQGFHFRRQRFARSPPDRLEISSFWTDAQFQNIEKFVINPDVVNHVTVHNLESFEKGTEALPVSDAIIHHYRQPRGWKPTDYQKLQNGNADRSANVRDAGFQASLPKLERALTGRFQLKSKDQLGNFLREMANKRPTNGDTLKNLDPFTNGDWAELHRWIEDYEY